VELADGLFFVTAKGIAQCSTLFVTHPFEFTIFHSFKKSQVLHLHFTSDFIIPINIHND
jgi:hypothetical protein